ncbi:ABC transporter permease [Virgibacillus proomii]|uniref:ABC transporter permease n=1 Tax=Virgibacillus proomii TaxID=84407 RepID=UPI000986EE96|nr:ABC transporter permease subunit [Virgibacillus proomii]
MTTVLLRKEGLENWRNKKWIWVPLVFILLAIMDPITNYYLPEIIESVGGLADGTVIELPDFTPEDAIMMSLGQYSSLGVLVIILLSMGTIAGERKSGVLELILVKPVSYSKFIIAKWLSLLLLIWLSFIIGMLTSWYYINILYGEIAFTTVLLVIFYYGLYFSLVCTLSIFYNAIVNSPGLVAFFTILTAIIISVVTKLFGKHMVWSPAKLTDHIEEMLITGNVTSDLISTTIVSILLILTLLFAAIYGFTQKQKKGS